MIIRRDKYLQEIRGVMHNGMIKNITGVCRCRKSYLLFELFKQSLIDNGVAQDHIIQIGKGTQYFRYDDTGISDDVAGRLYIGKINSI